MKPFFWTEVCFKQKFCIACSDRTIGNGHKPKHFFTVGVTEHWHRMPRQAVESPSLEIFRGHLDVVLGNRLNVVLPEQGGWTR